MTIQITTELPSLLAKPDPKGGWKRCEIGQCEKCGAYAKINEHTTRVLTGEELMTVSFYPNSDLVWSEEFGGAVCAECE